ncbi:alginate lyase family protein [Paenibacillus maysiensis]|uniref:alginate lyase family protein n=1 Tax=Paenibacillus maysiensis TaxID=1155954 RepID=UPI000472C1C0|nr:alginate lyase family protein [Paenibacillus maysiensis]
MKPKQWRMFLFSLVTLLLFSFTYPPVSIHAEDKPFIHPGMQHTRSELDQMKAQVAAQASPWIEEWNILRDNSLASLNYTPRPQNVVYRADRSHGTSGTYELENDSSAAYYHAIQWYITGDQAHANKAIAILNGWSSTLQSIEGNEAFITAGLNGYKLLNAAEILRYSNAGWQQRDMNRFSALMTNVFYPNVSDFGYLKGFVKDAAQEALCMLFVMDYGVWMNDQAIYNTAVDYYKNGQGHGAIQNFIQTSEGQTQEAGRDQGHNQLAVGLLVQAAEVGFNQRSVNANGADMYSYPNGSNLLVKGLEYTAKYNLGYTVPFNGNVTDSNGRTGRYSKVSPNNRGEFRPMYEQAYNFLRNKAGLPASNLTYTREVIDTVKLEGYTNDHLSYGGLLSAQDNRRQMTSTKVALAPRSQNKLVVTVPSKNAPLTVQTDRFKTDDQSNIKKPETFTLEYIGNKLYTFKSERTGSYVSVGDDQLLTAGSATAGDAEKFIVSQAANGLITLQSQKKQLFVSITSDNQLRASASASNTDNERFIVLPQK